MNLPFGIAGREHANETLKLRKAFTYSPNEKELYLHLSCLDPCGRIRINDQEFLCDDFLSTEFNLTPFLQNGKTFLSLSFHHVARRISVLGTAARIPITLGS